MIGTVFLGRYEVVSALGQGGMGQIFLAKHRSTNRQVVLKVMHDHFARQPRFREMFRREMDCLTRFQHPYAVAFYDASLQDPRGPCLVMEYIRGVDIERLLQRFRRFSPMRIGRLLGQLCEVLQAAHLQGIIHRDIKPGNLMVTGWETPLERLKVMDFGLAQLAEEQASRPAPAGGLGKVTVSGTPEYMSPEQASGRPLDGRSDLYSVGVVLYELLTGRRPFNKANPTALALAHINEVPATFAAAGAPGDISASLEAVVQSCLAKDPARRPGTALELAQRFERALGQPILETKSPLPSVTAPTPPPQTVPGVALRRTMLLAKTTPDGKPLPRKTQLDVKQATDETPGAEFTLEATMLLPETLDKLVRFAEELGGKVMDRSPAQIRAMLGTTCRVPAAPGGTNGFLPALTEMEFQIERKDPKVPHEQLITLRLSPLGGTTPPPAWRSCCDRIHSALRNRLGQAPSQARS